MSKNTIKKYDWIVKNDLTSFGDNSEKIIKKLLISKGYANSNSQNKFLYPEKPENIKLSEVGLNTASFQKVVKRLKKAQKNNEQVVVFGDYDADGICATTIVWETLDDLGFLVMPHIPKREDGYGIKIQSFDEILKDFPKTSLVITVDNGIVAHEAVEHAKSIGIDMVILDHHEINEKYPDAYSILHTKKLCGAGIAYFFALELFKTLKTSSSKRNRYDPLEIAAIGTVADQMSLTEANRIIVKHGLNNLRSTNRLGLRKLIMQAGMIQKDIGTYQINYVIAPRINAMGRIDEAMESLRLLCARNPLKATELARKLDETNRKRQLLVENALKKAEIKLKKYNFSNNVIILGDKNFHEGIIGLIASKLTGQYYLPSIVFSIGKDISKASARSIKGFDINANIKKLEHLTLNGGGHTMAAGFSIKTQNIKKFESEFEKISKQKITKKMLNKAINVDAKIGFDQLSINLAKNLIRFEPYGIGNPSPIFCSEEVEVLDYKKVGSGENHLKLTFRQNNKYVDAIYFNYPSDEFLKNKTIKICYQIDLNIWNNRENLQLIIKDIKF